MVLARLHAVVCIVAAILLCDTQLARAEWIADVTTEVVYEDNLDRAARRADRVDDVAFVPALSVGYYFQLTDATSLTVTADARGSIYSDFSRLSNLTAGLTAALREKFGLGAFAPWVRILGSGAVLDYRDDVRDSSLITAGIQAGKRLTDRLDVRGGYLYETADANNPVFDQEDHTVWVKGGVSITPSAELTLGYALRWGDLVVHSAPVTGATATGRAIIVDTFNRPFVARRIYATTHVLSAVLSYALTSHAAVLAGYEHQIAYGAVLTYPNNVFRVGFSYSY
jgi:hypothetical protein